MIGKRWLALALAVTGCSAPGAIPTTPIPAAQAGIERLPPPAKIGDLVGTSPEQVLATLGNPILRRRDGEAEAWLYASGPNCKVDLVFYRDSDRLKLTLAQTRSAPTAESACLRQIASLPAK